MPSYHFSVLGAPSLIPKRGGQSEPGMWHLLPGKHGLYMPPQISPAGSGLLSVGASPKPSGWEWSRGLRAEPDDHRCGCEQRRVRVESMVVRVLVGRDKLF